jgi:hypothetical protein
MNNLEIWSGTLLGRCSFLKHFFKTTIENNALGRRKLKDLQQSSKLPAQNTPFFLTLGDFNDLRFGA